MHSIAGSVPGVKPTFARFNGTNTSGNDSSNKDVKVKANNALQKFIKPQVGKGFWQIIQKIHDKYGDKGVLLNGFAIGEGAPARAKALAKALKRLDPRATRNGIAAILGNWFFESGGLNPGISNSAGAIGLGQWLDRGPALRAYARRHGKSWKDPATQLNFAMYGDSANTSIFKRILEGHGSISSLAAAFSREWERGGYDSQHVQGANTVRKILGYANGGIVTNPQIDVVGEGNGPETIVPWDITKRARAYRLIDRTLKHFKQQDAPTSQGEDSKLLLEILKVMTSIEKKLDSEITETRRLGEQPINVSGDFNVDGRKFARYLRTYLREFDRQTVVRGRYNLSDR
ncbi:phage tail tip lysozyme [Lactobacillus crispatus]|uniref:phage tail tip lysozyme n=1 Tax=Lactobacillus crispatus TaxID=47770 RepID=UPI0022AC7920|nr:phage tail tip lysozyme [Lactobacillus crispatus]MCZ3863689.1 phage tail tip lysozyme [Lactobacillus crispatus]MCZ3919636.1 phage tail tip lysozyme [Lactobacillus crispatus]MCZ3921808.1 phage tail tip lysozyme [Lactobacillus crispatus]MCZ3925700.1 phage tail tip lysozyme [Lactobacillus crispatus]MCZ3929719.1 phage tail tip lysozyme [Lactobacillus crispatus]